MTRLAKPNPLAALDTVAAVFEALSHAARRQILLVLQARDESMTSKQLSERFSTTWATTSRHLKTLEAAGLVSTVEANDGRERRYVLDSLRLVSVVDEWIGNFR